MTATILLVRHARHGDVDQRLTGRGGDVPLTAAGRTEAEVLAGQVPTLGASAIHASPQRRARETAEIVGRGLGLPVAVEARLDEVDFGEWTGRSFADLDRDPAWADWNTARGSARPPGGESMGEAQARAVACVGALAAANPGRTLLLVSHADIIRAVVAHVIGLPLDRLLALDIDPASVTTLHVGDWGGRLAGLNHLPAKSAALRAAA